MKMWKVWFDQVNQTVYQVLADNKDDAINKAKKLWKEENYPPNLGDVKEQESSYI